MVRYLLLTFILIVGTSELIGQTSLGGTLSDELGEPIILGNVTIYKNGNLITGIETDFNGKYLIEDLEPGTYDIAFSTLGYPKNIVKDMIVLAGKHNLLDLVLAVSSNLKEAVITIYEFPNLISDLSTQIESTRSFIKSLPSRNIDSLNQYLKPITFKWRSKKRNP